MIKAGVWGDQGFFKLGNGIGHLIDIDFFLAEDALELGNIARNGLEHFFGQIMGKGHFTRIGNRSTCLIFEILGPTIPELHKTHARIKDCGRVNGALLPIMTDGGLQIICTAPA
ncbi:hypothetical protein H206_05372 [Candidatus Electrothrix aarhusensis]|uniref:Uncharacterized protein n=1 Tax=Candidatus Electrothrix aarhusensis TaxID=1859131 RepID=A0A444J4T7_9BACT|nr:hypothetical protein H206_05372 [Candidatus Electrothrix aarhusensis]